MEVALGDSNQGQGTGPSNDESNSIFESLNFSPQLFINDVRNAVDDIIDEGFEFFKDQAPKVLGVKDAEISSKVCQGVDAVQYTVQLKLEKQLDIWEKYCLLHCFVVPEGLEFPEINDAKGSFPVSTSAVGISDKDLDTQLESLREKLVVAGRESAELHRELSTLERQSAAINRQLEALEEAIRPLEENSTHDVIKAEIERTGLELQKKMQVLSIERRDKMENLRLERIRSPNLIHAKRKNIQGFEASLEDLQHLANNL